MSVAKFFFCFFLIKLHTYEAVPDLRILKLHISSLFLSDLLILINKTRKRPRNRLCKYGKNYF